MTLRQYILEGKKRLEDAELECADPLLHMKQIAEGALGIASADLIRRWETEVEDREKVKIEAWLQRRLTGEPFQYIAGYEWFWDCKFAVGPGVLIPRPETELLVELALELCPERKTKIGELGAGSGNIGITLLRERPQWEWFACEKNPASVPYLEKNSKLIPPGSQYMFKTGDFFEIQTPFDWIIANPPYVRQAEILTLSREVRHEPAMALDGGASGTETVNRLIAYGAKKLKPGGGILLEIGSEQGPSVLASLQAAGYRDARIEKDLAGKDRVAYGLCSS